MRKIFNFMVSTLDGYYAGPNDEFDWPLVDDEFNEFALAQLDEVDTLLFGRTTYEGMASYWPTPIAQENDPIVATRMNTINKLVISRTLKSATWSNTRLLPDLTEIPTLKAAPGKDIAIFGSSALTVSLLAQGLIDELRVMINPILLAAGKPLFHTAPTRMPLTLEQTRPFKSGNILLTYRPVTP